MRGMRQRVSEEQIVAISGRKIETRGVGNSKGYGSGANNYIGFRPVVAKLSASLGQGRRRIVQMRQQRPAPDQIEQTRQRNLVEVLTGDDRFHIECASAKFHRFRLNVAGADCRVRKSGFEEPQTPAVAARKIEDCPYLVGSMSQGGVDGAVRTDTDAEIMAPLAWRIHVIVIVDSKRHVSEQILFIVRERV